MPGFKACPLLWILLTLCVSAASDPPSVKLDPELQSALKNAPTQSQWPNSDYVKLLDLGKIVIQKDGSTTGIFRETYKLFNSSARSLAEVNLPYNSSYQDIQLLYARTIEPDGKELFLKLDEVRESGLAGDYQMYSDAMALSFSMPGIQNGSVIDYEYKIITHSTLFPGQNSTYWGFNDVMPVLLSRYTLQAPSALDLSIKIHHAADLKPSETISKNGETKTWIFEMRNLAPIPVEIAMPPVADIRAWLETSTIPSWQTIGKWYWNLQDAQDKPVAAIREKVSQLTKGCSSETASAERLYRWVADHVRYVGLEFGLSAYRPHPADQVFQNLYGDCKDKATLLITMLNLAGISASPALLHANQLRPLEESLPSITAFNHCIVKASVSGKPVWLDPTAEGCPYGQIPASDQGAQALVVSPDGGTLQTIPSGSSEQDGIDISTLISFEPGGSAHTSTTALLFGQTAQIMRASMRSMSPDNRKLAMLKVASRIGIKGHLLQFSLPVSSAKDPYSLSFALSSDVFDRSLGSNLLLIPLPSCMEALHENPYPDKKRVWPIVQEHASHMTNRVTITLPPGYTLDHLPADVKLNGPLESYQRSIGSEPNAHAILITERFLQHAGSAPASAYPQERAFWNDLIKALGDAILLKK